MRKARPDLKRENFSALKISPRITNFKDILLEGNKRVAGKAELGHFKKLLCLMRRVGWTWAAAREAASRMVAPDQITSCSSSAHLLKSPLSHARPDR